MLVPASEKLKLLQETKELRIVICSIKIAAAAAS
jgi:hypothetical protein